jgi:hypothetical protein
MASMGQVFDGPGISRESRLDLCNRHLCLPHPNAICPNFETRFVRMQYVDTGKFNLSYMRHAGRLSLDYRLLFAFSLSSFPILKKGSFFFLTVIFAPVLGFRAA